MKGPDDPRDFEDRAVTPPVRPDWKQLLRDLVSGNVAQQARAADAFLRLIDGILRALGAFRRAPQSIQEDIAQDVLSKLVQRADTIDHPSAYARTCTHSAFVDWCRKRENLAPRIDEVPPQLADPRAEIPEDRALIAAEIGRLRRAVAQLEPKLRRVIQTLYPADPRREPTSQAHAAEILGIDLPTLKNRKRKAMERIRAYMRRDENLAGFWIGACRQKKPRKPPIDEDPDE